MLQEKILISIYENGPLTSEEISVLTDSDSQTIKTLIQRLEKGGLVEKLRKKISERGRPEFIYTLASNANNFVSRFLIKSFFEKRGYEIEYEKILDKNKRIDIFGIRGNESLGVEIKFNQIQWGFLKYKTYVNKLYIALPKTPINVKILNKCKDEGVGVLQLNRNIKEILKPKTNTVPENPAPRAKQKPRIDYFPILATFFPEVKEKTSKQIKIESGLSHEPTFRILKYFVKNKYLKEKKVGKTNVYEFIFNNESHLVFVYYMTNRIKNFKNNHPILLKRLSEFCGKIQAHSVVLFGSYAKGTETEKSDIDVLVVSDERNIEKTALTFRTKYNIAINPVVVKPNDFKNIKEENPAFYRDLVKFGIVLYGLDFFFKEVYKNGKAY